MHLLNNQGSHHVVLFMFQYVTVPHILIPACSWAWRNGEWHAGKLEREVHCGDFSWVRPYRFLPTSLIELRRASRSSERRCAALLITHVERLPRDELYVHEVEVHWMSVASQVHDLPDLVSLSISQCNSLCNGIHVPSSESLTDADRRSVCAEHLDQATVSI